MKNNSFKNNLTSVFDFLLALPGYWWILILAFIVFIFPGSEKGAFLLIGLMIVLVLFSFTFTQPELLKHSGYFSNLIALVILFFLLFYSINFGSLKPIFDFYSVSIRAEGYLFEIKKTKDEADSILASASKAIQDQLFSITQRTTLLDAWMKAVSDDRKALFDLDKLSASDSFPFKESAKFLSDSIRQTYKYERVLSNPVSWGTFFPAGANIASSTAEDLIRIFKEKCNDKDTVVGLFDLLCNEGKILDIEKKRFAFWVIKSGNSNFAAGCALNLLSRQGYYPAAPSSSVDEKEILKLDFEEWLKSKASK